MQRIRKLSNDLKEALLPKLDRLEPRRKPSYRGGQLVQTDDTRKTANRSVGHHDSAASSREARAERERGGYNQAMKGARKQSTEASSVAFPSSSPRSRTRTKAQEKPVPVPSLNHKQTTSEGAYWDPDAFGTSPTTSPYRYALDPRSKPLPSPPGTLPARKPHRRCPYSPSRYFAETQSTPDVTFPSQSGTPTTNDRNPASPDDADLSTSHSTQSQCGVPSWPPEGPATIQRQKRTPKSSIDSLYRSQTDMKDFRAPVTTTSPRDAGHGHSRTASAPAPRDAQSLPRRREPQVAHAARDPCPDPEPKALFRGDVSSVYSRSSYQTTGSSTRDPKTSLQVRELPISRSVHVQSAAVRRAASHKAQIVYPSYVTTALPPLPAPVPVPQRQAHTPARARDQAAPRTTPRRRGDEFYTHSRRRASEEQQIEVSYITMREIAQMEGERTHKDLTRELAQWDGVDANAAPAPHPPIGGTRPLVVKKRSAMFGARDQRSTSTRRY